MKNDVYEIDDDDDIDEPSLLTDILHTSMDACRATFALDLRSIALYRMATASVLFYCLSLRWTDLEAFYSDVGTMPRKTHLEHASSTWQISLHYVSGETSIVAVLFVLHAIVLIGLFLGLHTMKCTFVCWMFEISLQNRNFLVLQGGDVVCRLMLMYAMFLPLSAVWSLDELIRRRVESRGGSGGSSGGSGRTTSRCGRSPSLLRNFFSETNPRVYVGDAVPQTRKSSSSSSGGGGSGSGGSGGSKSGSAYSFLPSTHSKQRGTVVYHVGALALVVQIVQLYACAGALKTPDKSWSVDHNALELALHTDEFTTPVGRFVRDSLGKILFGDWSDATAGGGAAGGGDESSSSSSSSSSLSSLSSSAWLLQWMTIISHKLEIAAPLLVLPPFHLVDGGRSRLLVVAL